MCDNKKTLFKFTSISSFRLLSNFKKKFFIFYRFSYFIDVNIFSAYTIYLLMHQMYCWTYGFKLSIQFCCIILSSKNSVNILPYFNNAILQ